MRDDMAKVVTERPRSGSHNKSKKTGGRVGKDHVEDEDHGPVKLKASKHGQYGWECKGFTDLIGPLRRYLKKQVGRPWAKVYSEIKQTLDGRSLTGIHILQHVKWEVEQECYAKNGKVYYTRQSYRGELSNYEVTGLYVHPLTHLLCYKTPKRWRSNMEAFNLSKALKPYGFSFEYGAGPDPRNWIIVDALTVLERIDELWYVHRFTDLDPFERVGTMYLHGREIPVLRMDQKEPLKRKVSTRQLGKREKELWEACIKHTHKEAA